jgi:hypothetical protein
MSERESNKTGGKKYGDFVVKNGKMLFNRVGPVNAQTQKNKKAPVKRGVWAFPYPVFDYFFVSASYSISTTCAPKKEKIIKLTNDDIIFLKKRLKGLKALCEKAKVKPPIHKWDYSSQEHEITEIEGVLAAGEAVGWSYRHIMHKPKYKKITKLRQFYWGGPVYAMICPKGKESHFERGWYLYDNIYDYVKDLRKHLIMLGNDSSDFGKRTQVFKAGITGLVGANKDWNLSRDHLEVFIPMKAGDLKDKELPCPQS